jgi:hypothetical protein
MSGFIEGADRERVTLFLDRLEDWTDEDYRKRRFRPIEICLMGGLTA